MNAYPLKEIDLIGDGNGHHIPGTPYVYSHGWNPIDPSSVSKSLYTSHDDGVTTTQHKHSSVSTFKRDTPRTLTTKERRETLQFGHEKLKTIIEGAGGRLEHNVDIQTMVYRMSEAKTPGERAKVAEEISPHLHALNEALKLKDEADRLSRREDIKNRLKTHDGFLKKTKLGRSLLKVRDELIEDAKLDKSSVAKEFFKKYGGNWVKELAASQLAAALIGSVVALSSTVLNDPEAGNIVSSVLSNPFSATAIGVASATAFGFGIKGLKKMHHIIREKHKYKVALQHLE